MTKGVKLHHERKGVITTDKEEMTGICNKKLRLVRAEYGYSQERMAEALGLSKKTLLEIEKGRSSLGWTGTAALCAVFRDSEVLYSAFGGEALELVKTLATVSYVPQKHMSGGLFWSPVTERGGYRILQNVISQHYRLFSPENELLAASFDLNELLGMIPGKNAEGTE